MLLGVQDLMRNFFLAQQLGQKLRDFDGSGTYQHRLTTAMAIANILQNSIILLLAREKNHIA
jgi:hypothetical protein